MTEQKQEQNDLYDQRIAEWTQLDRDERLRRAAVYQQQYPMGEYLFMYRKYMERGMDPLGAYLKWIWIDKGL